jgi:SpoVK/Ycf46/Vps4 family AAA+-type ATPase
MSEMARHFTTEALHVGETLHPTIVAYARNLLVGTRVRNRTTSEGVKVALDNFWFRKALWSLAKREDGTPVRPRKTLEELDTGDLPSPEPVGRAPGIFGANVERMGKLLGLGRTERAIVQFAVAIRLVRSFDTVAALYGPLTTPGAEELLAVALGVAPASVRRALSPDSRLRATRLVEVDTDPEPLFQKVVPNIRLPDLLTSPRLDARQLADAYLSSSSAPTLSLADFEHVRAGVARMRALLASALEAGTRGVHVLLHGPSGCGKSELARVLARELGAELRVGRHESAEVLGQRPWSRLSGLVAVAPLAEERSLLLLEEGEDLFESGPPAQCGPRGPEGWFFRVLELNVRPVVWTLRDPSRLDPSVLRRFSAVLELPGLDERQRAALWRREASADAPPEPALRLLARRYDVSPAEVATAARAARVVTGGAFDPAVAEALLVDRVKAATGRTPAPVRPVASGYVEGALNASVDLEAVAASLAAGPTLERPGVTLCLHGPPGTGKSEWVRHLSERLGKQLVVRNVSDIESKWVGESEKAVARAFADAERDGALLLFDEADTFLRNREGATHRWEISLTNEFLQRLESARGIVACTTNGFDSLDPAVMRRFDLKIAFDYLRPAQAVRVFRAVFGGVLVPDAVLDEPALERALERAGPLAPGDFAVVARRAGLLGKRAPVEWLLRELETEVGTRPRTRSRIAGFRNG